MPIGIAGVAAGEQNIDDQLQVGLPSDRLPKQNNSWENKNYKIVTELVNRAPNL